MAPVGSVIEPAAMHASVVEHDTALRYASGASRFGVGSRDHARAWDAGADAEATGMVPAGSTKLKRRREPSAKRLMKGLSMARLR
jgi:hypothetical protein